MTREEFIKLVLSYGHECAIGGQGYMLTDEYKVLNEIRAAVDTHWRDADKNEVAQ